jgi:hypothetical protein
MTPNFADPDRRQTVVQGPNKLQYVIAVVTMATLGVAAATAIVIAKPMTGMSPAETMVAVAAIFGFLAPTTLSLMTYLKAQETHLSVNSRLDAFLSTAKMAAHAQGVTEGRQEGRRAADERTDILAGGAQAETRASRERLESYIGENRAAQAATRERLNAMDEAAAIPQVEAPVIVVPPKT